MAPVPRTRPNPPIVHMLVAILVVMAPALLAVAWFQRAPEPPVTKVDPTPVAAAAASSAPYAVAVPENLPAGWVCTRARWTPSGQPGLGGSPSPGNAFSLGFLSPEQMYFAVDQRDSLPDALVTSILAKHHDDGTSAVAGRTWARVASDDAKTRALVLKEADHVTVVSGDLGYPALEAFASTLAFRRG